MHLAPEACPRCTKFGVESSQKTIIIRVGYTEYTVADPEIITVWDTSRQVLWDLGIRVDLVSENVPY